MHKALLEVDSVMVEELLDLCAKGHLQRLRPYVSLRPINKKISAVGLKYE